MVSYINCETCNALSFGQVCDCHAKALEARDARIAELERERERVLAALEKLAVAGYACSLCPGSYGYHGTPSQHFRHVAPCPLAGHHPQSDESRS